MVSSIAFLGNRKNSFVEHPDGLYTSSNQTRQTTKKLILGICTLHRMSSEHCSFSHERLRLKPTRNRRTTLLLVHPFYRREPTPTLLHCSTPRLPPETVYYCVSCMHSTFIILSHMSSFFFSSPTLLLNFGWCLVFLRVRTISSSNMTYAHTLFSQLLLVSRSTFPCYFPNTVGVVT